MSDEKILPDTKSIATVGTSGPPIDAGGIPAPPATQGKYVLTLYVAADGTADGPKWEKPS